MSWNPEQYLKFAEPRLRPALDLLGRISLEAPSRIFDLGCGTGTLTRMLAQRWPRAEVWGVDSSEAMLAKAAEDAGNIQWRRQDLADATDQAPADLIYSNAALHWLAAHDQLFPTLMRRLAPGGVLAVQMPRNFAAASHTAIADTVLQGSWRATLEPMLGPSPVSKPSDYFEWLLPHAEQIDIWETEYLQILSGRDAVKEWTKGTWLKPFLDALEEPLRSDFEAAYAARVGRAYPPRADGRTLFPFRRLFIIARR